MRSSSIGMAISVWSSVLTACHEPAATVPHGHPQQDQAQHLAPGAEATSAADKQSQLADAPVFALRCRGEDRTEDSLMGVAEQQLSDTFVVDVPNETLFQVKNGSLVQYPCKSGGCTWLGASDRLVLRYHEQWEDGSGGGTAVLDRRLGTLTLDESAYFPSTGLSRQVVDHYTCEKTKMPAAAQGLTGARKF